RYRPVQEVEPIGLIPDVRAGAAEGEPAGGGIEGQRARPIDFIDAAAQETRRDRDRRSLAHREWSFRDLAARCSIDGGQRVSLGSSVHQAGAAVEITSPE